MLEDCWDDEILLVTKMPLQELEEMLNPACKVIGGLTLPTGGLCKRC